MTVLLKKTKVFSAENALLPVCAEILREPKNGPDVVLVAKRAQSALITKAGNLLSVQGSTARLVVIDDPFAFDRLSDAQMGRFLPKDKPFVRVENADTTAEAIMQAAKEAMKA
jgi:hypothetical protein